MYDIDNILANSGFGESVSLGGKRNRKVKPKAPNPVAYAESYAFIRNDATRMELENVRMHVKVARIKASGEAFDDIKDKVVTTVKDGYSKVKKTLIELYEKAIRFFTETVRYFFSNEKKIGKTLATIKAALKKSPKDGEGTAQIVKVEELAKLDEEYGVSESYKGYGELSKGKRYEKKVSILQEKDRTIFRKQFEKGHINEDYVTEKVKYHEEKIASSRSKELEIYHKSMKKIFL